MIVLKNSTLHIDKKMDDLKKYGQLVIKDLPKGCKFKFLNDGDWILISFSYSKNLIKFTKELKITVHPNQKDTFTIGIIKPKLIGPEDHPFEEFETQVKKWLNILTGDKK